MGYHLGDEVQYLYLNASVISPGGFEYGKAFISWHSMAVKVVVDNGPRMLVIPLSGVSGNHYDLSKAILIDSADIYADHQSANIEIARRQRELEENRKKMGLIPWA